MLKHLLGLLGIGGAMAAVAAPQPALYDPLFCDQPVLYRPAPGSMPSPWQVLLFDERADAQAVRRLAADAQGDSRVRALAYGWLRTHRQPVPRDELLGVVFEVEIGGAVDVLAAYADGRLRFLNHAGRMAAFDSLPAALGSRWQALMAAARQASPAASAWQRAGSRLPGPGEVRVTFVRSDGLHRLQGRFDPMQRDATTGPLLVAGAQTVAQIVELLR
jgi:hypothetical protein